MSIEKICLNCNNGFKVYPYREKIANFCCVSCGAKFRWKLHRKKYGVSEDEIVRLYVEENLSLKKVSKKMRTSPIGILEILRKNRVKMKPKGAPRGEKHYKFKGGTHIKSGYRWILQNNHPYSNCKNYVLEHRLVMEKHLGRYLKSNEVMHHLDGNKLNNHIDNLYLFPDRGKHRTYHCMLKRFVREIVSGNKTRNQTI